ncbi:MAG TPA: NUDIX domain-containing protein [Stellaceae bacterium]|jgi:8-oxo-dGTP pyrophosphatase MutT (NUDIX family)|nr:NUDIX domain-containing protein [Stellaceae bacterium]
MPIAPALPAATLLLVRDGLGGVEVLLVRRHAKSGFAAGALVFPGGKVDAADAALARYGRAADLPLFRAAAIRETWEEAGIFLAGHAGGEGLLDHEELRRLRGAYLDPLTDLATILAQEALELATDRLARFAHWITPEAEPRRFDTQFFIAAAPAGQEAIHDGRETLECFWLSPRGAIAEADAGRALLMFPTRLNLMKLARARSAAEALERAGREPVVTVQPVMTIESGERIVRIAGDSGYELTEMRLRPLQR